LAEALVLRNALKDFAEASNTSQIEKSPTIFLSIPIFNKLFDTLDELIEKKVLVNSAIRARKKLKVYYQLTDKCHCHYISTILNPATKMQ